MVTVAGKISGFTRSVMSARLTVEQIKGEVLRFWNVFMEKNAEALMNFYAPDSSVFSSISARVEPGRLSAARREREYFHAKSTVRSTPGNVEVILVSDTSAVAVYNFAFHATKVAG